MNDLENLGLPAKPEIYLGTPWSVKASKKQGVCVAHNDNRITLFRDLELTLEFADGSRKRFHVNELNAVRP